MYFMNGMGHFNPDKEDIDIEVILEDDVYSATFYDWFIFRRKDAAICTVVAIT